MFLAHSYGMNCLQATIHAAPYLSSSCTVLSTSCIATSSMYKLKWPSHIGQLDFNQLSHCERLIMAQPDRPDFRTFLRGCNGCEGEEFFHCGAVKLAQKLLGQYLYCRQSKILVRILETEAYPEDDAEVYTSLFLNHENPELHAKFKINGGRMVLWKPIGKYWDANNWHLYITAGTEDCGDVVYLRSCEPIEGRHVIEERRHMTDETPKRSKTDVLIGPTKLPVGLGTEWESNPVLYEGGGVQLFYGTIPPEEKVLCGKREKAMFGKNVNVTNENYRFALQTYNPAYPYANKKTLKPLQP